jgi:hypothetical protein
LIRKHRGKLLFGSSGSTRTLLLHISSPHTSHDATTTTTTTDPEYHPTALQNHPSIPDDATSHIATDDNILPPPQSQPLQPLGDAYQTEIKARRKQRFECMARYANRLAELKQDSVSGLGDTSTGRTTATIRATKSHDGDENKMSLKI